MTVTGKIKTALVDAALVFGLVVAVAGVYNVETRLPRPKLASAKAGYEEKIEVEKGLSGTTERRTYVLRTKKDKAKWVALFGGSPQTEGCVQDGLNWLVRHQADDGSWSNECLGDPAGNPLSKCERAGACTIPGQHFPMAQTGLALLALQASGNYESNDEKYSSQVRRGLDWVIEHQGHDGALVDLPPGQPRDYPHTFMYGHAMAAFALAEACAVRKAQGKSDEPRLRSAAVKAIEFIETIQHNDGGWRYTAQKEERSDCSVSGWVMLALKSAREADIPVSADTVNGTRYSLQVMRDVRRPHSLSERRGGGVRRDHGGGNVDPSPPAQGSRITAREIVGKLPRRPGGYPRQERAEGSAEFYVLYNATLAMYQAGGDNWNRWNDAVRDAVVALQIKGSGCERGSWDPKATFSGDQGGRIYSTALATLMLEVYYRFSREGEATVLDTSP